MPLLPQSVELSLAGSTYLVSEWRVRDILQIEGLLAGCLPDPLEGLPGPDVDPAVRRTALLAAYARARDWPPRLYSPAWNEAMSTPGGLTAFLWVALSRQCPRLAVEDVPEILAAVTPDEWERLRAVVWGLTPAHQVLTQLKARTEGSPSPPADWEAAFDFLAKGYGLTYDQIGSLTLTQYGNYMRGGKRERHSLTDAEFAVIVESDEAKGRKRAAVEAWSSGRAAAVVAGTLDDYPVWDAEQCKPLPWSEAEVADPERRLSDTEKRQRLALQTEHPDWPLPIIRQAVKNAAVPTTTADIAGEPEGDPAPSDSLSDRYVATFAAERGLHADDVREAAAYLEGVKATWAPGPESAPQTVPIEHFGRSTVDVAANIAPRVQSLIGQPPVSRPADQPPADPAQ